MSEEICWRGRTLYLGNDCSGVDVSYIRRRRMLSIGGWYDSVVGIASREVPLGEFLRGLGITERDCIAALRKEA
jgi:hypothetical protein